jgi:cell division protein FtsW (lipid II flippase)
VARALTAVPALVIARQPDLGTAVTLLPIGLAAAFVAGMPLRTVGILALAALLIAPVAWKFGLQDYQRERVSTFLNPSQDARGAGYQQIQARITVGSGGLWGKGFAKGTQGQLRFLPVAHNDFIFSVWPRSGGSRASWSLWGCTCSSSSVRSSRPRWQRTGSVRSWYSECWPASRSRSFTTSPCRPGSPRSKG